MASDRLLPLDGLRGLAALLVVGYHYTTRYQELFGHPAPLRLSLPLGHYGVQLFFVISGFVIFMTLERTQDWRDFLVSRFARLFPAYWVAVLLTWLVVWRFSLPGREVPASAMWINLTMLQGWLHAPHVDGVYWTLTVELAFYAMVLCLHALRLLPRLPLVVAGWLCAMLVSHWAETRLGWRWTDMARTTLLLEHANLFMAGMLLYRGSGEKVAAAPPPGCCWPACWWSSWSTVPNPAWSAPCFSGCCWWHCGRPVGGGWHCRHRRWCGWAAFPTACTCCTRTSDTSCCAACTRRAWRR